MQVKDILNWKAIKLPSGIILSEDFDSLSTEQKELINNLSVYEYRKGGYYQPISTNLVRIRIEQKLSQSQLARQAGISPQIVSHYEQRIRNINKAQADTLYALSKALSCSIEDLLEFDEQGNLIM